MDSFVTARPTRFRTKEPPSRWWDGFEYPPNNYEPPKGTLRVHSPEIANEDTRGRILQQWSLCIRPRTGVARGGCRNGHFGCFVRENGVIRRAIWVGAGKAECDWITSKEGQSDKGSTVKKNQKAVESELMKE